MPGPIHAFDYLNSPTKLPESGVCVLFGGQRFLTTAVLQRMMSGDGAGELQVARLNPDTMRWSDLMDELGTKSLFGGDGPKLVILDDADDYVSKNRDKLETLFEKKNLGGLLVLIVEAWLATTRLYKTVDQHGMHVHCDLPVIQRGKSKNPDDARIAKWFIERAKKIFGFKLESDGANLLRELCNNDLGRMDQELAKLALFLQPGESASQDRVRTVVGGWRNETMWTAIDAAVDGDATTSLKMLDKLFRNEEHPLALFGQISWSLRRYVLANRALAAADKSDVAFRGGKYSNRLAFEAGRGNWNGQNSDSIDWEESDLEVLPI
jgi:DNA polymerase-3 subunit delta